MVVDCYTERHLQSLAFTRQNPQEGFLIRKEGLFPRRLPHPLDSEGPDTSRDCQTSLADPRAHRGNIEGTTLALTSTGPAAPLYPITLGKLT